MLELTLRLVASLSVVVGLMLLLARLGARRFKGGAGAVVQVVHRQPLSRGSAVAVVTVGTRVLVLGTTEQHVSLLTELDPDEVHAASYDVVDEIGVEDALGAAAARTPAATAVAVVPTAGALAGSVLSAQTWRQAMAVATRRRAS